MRKLRPHGVRLHRGKTVKSSRLSLSFAVSLLVLSAPFMRAEATTKHVLVIHSYHQGLAWTDGQNAGIRETFAPHEDIDLAIEYLDSKRFPFENIASPVADYLEQKWERDSFDAIIVTDNSALDFMAAYRTRLFPDTPVSFCGINDLTPEMLGPFGGQVTGVIQTLDPEENIRLIQKLQPDLQRLVIVSGTTPTAKIVFKKVKAVVEKWSDNFTPVWLDELDTATLKVELAKLNAQDAVLLCNFNRDANGVYYSHEESARMIAQASRAPVYAMEDHYLGTGVVGGFMNASHDQGRVAAERCLEVLQTGNIPDVVLTCPNAYLFDFSAMSRFRLSVDALPATAIIVNQPVSFFHQHKRLIWNTVTLFFFMLVAFVSVSFGLIRSRRAETKLRVSRQNLSTTLNSIGDAVISTDTESRIVRMNRCAERLTGWDRNDAVGKDLGEVFHIINGRTREPQKNPVDETLASGEVVGLSNHTILISRSGEEHQIADSSAPIRDETDEISGVVLVFRDVTEEYAVQEQLRQSQKLDAIGQLAGGVAHDLNNMMGGIMGGAELLEPRIPPQDDKAAGYLEIIQESVQRAAGLTTKLLAFAKQQPTASTPVDVHRIIEDTVALLKQTIDKRIRIESNLEAEASTVVGDDVQLQSVFLNLGINSAQAMPDGGSLVFSTRTTEVTEAQCRAGGSSLKKGLYLQVEVRDTGCGIPPENMERIFEPFFTTKRPGEGTGLGLAASHGTITQHGGVITVYSEPNVGTASHILLPLTEDAATAIPVGIEPIHGEGTILLVDDEPVMRATAAALLRDYGYRVLLATNGQEAIEMVDENGPTIDLVVLDMIMPEMNGRDCFFHLRKKHPGLPVVLSSGFSRMEDLEDMKNAGLAGFIQKPFRAADLSRVVAEGLKH